MSSARFPIYVLLDRVRSLHNVGSFFRTCDAVNITKLYLSEYTPVPPNKEITKTALGAEHTVPFEYIQNPVTLLKQLRRKKVQLVAVETGKNAVAYNKFQPSFPVCLIFGNEVTGISSEILKLVDQVITIPMFGIKESLNVSVAGGIVLYDILQKYFKTKK